LGEKREKREGRHTEVCGKRAYGWALAYADAEPTAQAVGWRGAPPSLKSVVMVG
jgi:hypothetical protein